MTGPLMHVALFTWRDGTDPEHGRRLAAELRAMAADLPQVLSYRCGPDLGLPAATCDFAVVSVVASPDDLTAYLAHPRHRAVVDELVAPVLQHRVTAQIPLAGDDPLLTATGTAGPVAP